MVVAMVNETVPTMMSAVPHPEPCQRLWDLLDEWMALDETRVTWEAVEALYREIVDCWRTHPDDAEAWYQAWRTSHHEARPT